MSANVRQASSATANPPSADVSFPERLVELVVVPYDEEALVEIEGPDGHRVDLRRGRSTGSNGGRTGSGSTATTNSNAPSVVPSASTRPPPKGSPPRLKIAKTELGDETLELAADDCLDARAGYLPMPGGEKWLNRSRVQMTRCWLGHVALTPDPAYTGARVLVGASDGEQ